MDDKILEKIKSILRTRKVHLWLSPYVDNVSGAATIPQNLVSECATKTGLDEAVVKQALEFLQQGAIENFCANQRYRDHGIATLKVTFANLEDACAVSSAYEPRKIEINLTSLGRELRHKISSDINISESQFRLIASGRLLEESSKLSSQNIAHRSEILCILLSKSVLDAEQRTEWTTIVSKSRDVISQCASGKYEQQIDITDQNGKQIVLPEHEKKALAVAMTLHERGRAAMKKQEYARALIFLLEADREYESCSSEILAVVDNYGIENLDIVWCYLCLLNVNSLQDAKRRLTIAEQCFRRSYGQDLERLAALKKTTSEEYGLLVRLHLLQGALAFYEKKYDDAKRLLDQVDKETRTLEVSDDSLCQLMDMGYSAAESRVALRSTSGNVMLAANLIAQRRQDAAEAKQRDKQDAKRSAVENKLGRALNGEKINVEAYNGLLSMGFSEKSVISALRDTDNNTEEAVKILTLTTASVVSSNNDVGPSASSVPDLPRITDELWAVFASLGLDKNRLNSMLTDKHFDIVSFLKSVVGENEAQRIVNNQLPHLASSGVSATEGDKQLSSEEVKQWNEVRNDIAESPYDHLDLSFEEERKFLRLFTEKLAEHYSNSNTT